MLRKLFALLGIVAGLTACESATEPVSESEQFDFGLTRISAETTGPVPLAAVPLAGEYMPTPHQFVELTETWRDGLMVREWRVPESRSQGPVWFGSWLGLAGMQGDEDITLTFRAEFLNGPSKRPLDIVLGAMVGVTQAMGSTDYNRHNFVEAVQLENGDYQVVAPMDRGKVYNVLNAVIGGMAVNCHSLGTKRVMIDRIRYESSDGWTGDWAGALVLTFECGAVNLPRYDGSPSFAAAVNPPAMK